MDNETLTLINSALAPYGSRLNCEGYILKQNATDPTGIKIIKKGRRLRYESESRLFASGPVSSKGVSDFVESFWYWKKES